MVLTYLKSRKPRADNMLDSFILVNPTLEVPKSYKGIFIVHRFQKHFIAWLTGVSHNLFIAFPDTNCPNNLSQMLNLNANP